MTLKSVYCKKRKTAQTGLSQRGQFIRWIAGYLTGPKDSKDSQISEESLSLFL